MNDTIHGTVCCILCRGKVIYKDGDKFRFKNHMNNEHGAFFEIDYLLASCLLENDQKAAVAKTVECTIKPTSSKIPGTVCCILCCGMVFYKDGDKSRFKNHMNNLHGAFFDIDYLLASCLMENDKKEAVAKTAACIKLYQQIHRSGNTVAANMNLDTADTSSYTSEEARDTRHEQARPSARLVLKSV